jgi:dihydrofolate reductase
MTTLTVDLFTSADGFAGSDGLPGYFGYSGPDLEAWIADSADPTVSIMGRRTYEMMASMPEEYRDDGWERMSRLETVVFSHTLERVEWPNSRVCGDDLAGEVKRMKMASRTPLRTVGSLSVARQLIGAGLVDRLRLMSFPLLAGPYGREPAFMDVSSTDLELVDHRVLDGRVLLIEYRPTGNDIPRV